MRRGKNPLKRVLYVVAILGVLVALSYACGCAPDLDVPDADVAVGNGYNTVGGIYMVRVQEVEDTCSPSDDVKDRIDSWYWMLVTVQERREDGSYLVDMSLADLAWFDVEVAPDGTVDAEENFYGIWVNQLVGTLTPEELVATATLNTMDRDGQVMCYVVYVFDGYPLFETAEPPERFSER